MGTKVTYPQLNKAHWTIENFKERIDSKHWKYLLLNEQDKIIVSGNIRQLIAKRLGYGVVEISKKPL